MKKPVRRPAKTFKPGQFLYYGGMVFEVDCPRETATTPGHRAGHQEPLQTEVHEALSNLTVLLDV